MIQNDVLDWQKPAALLEAKEVEYRDQFSSKLEKLPPETIIKRYAYYNYEEIESLLKNIIAELHLKDIGGVGVELGSGCSILSSVFLNLFDKIEKIYSVEVVEGLAFKIGPKIIEHFSRDKINRYQSVWGSFDTLELPDNSVDFIIEYDSLHHSDNLPVTFSEISRVLKPSGICIFLDRCHPDTLTDAERNSMLDKVYSKEFLIENCYPLDAILTRRENGEHEYRFSEWQSAIKGAGLKIDYLGKTYKEVTLKQAIYSLKLNLLNGDKQKTSHYVYLNQKLQLNPANKNGVYISPMKMKNEVGHEISVFILKKTG